LKTRIWRTRTERDWSLILLPFQFDNILNMKLRTTGNSVRLRLSMKDLRSLADTGVVEEKLRISDGENGALTYRLTTSGDISEISADLATNELTISLSTELADSLINTDRVGCEATQGLNGNRLTILVEKDFTCLTPRAGDDDKDAFPHPLTEQAY